METALTPLDADRLRAAVADTGIAIDVLAEIDSTNAWLLRLAPEAAHRHAVFAEAQDAGRGRLGRVWRAQTARHLLFSFGWRFEKIPLSDLSLAAGVAVRNVLTAAGMQEIMLKWPNDVFWRGRKLAGILVETRVTTRCVLAVVGVGVNVCFGADEEAAIGVPAVDLRAIAGHVPDRNVIGARLVTALNSCCEVFSCAGFDPFRDDWRRHQLCVP